MNNLIDTEEYILITLDSKIKNLKETDSDHLEMWHMNYLYNLIIIIIITDFRDIKPY